MYEVNPGTGRFAGERVRNTTESLLWEAPVEPGWGFFYGSLEGITARMIESERLMKRILWWGLAACVVLPGVVLAAITIADHARTYAVSRSFAGLSPEQRAERFYRVGRERDWRLAGLVRQSLHTATDRDELQAAGYAALRLEDLDFLPLLRRRAEEGPDDPVRAMLITYAARLSNRDTRLCEWLEPGAHSDQPWLRVGCAAGLMQLGRIEAGPMLLAAARDPNRDVAGFALRELAWTTRPMAQAIGRPFATLEADPIPADAALLASLDAFWKEHVTVTLLNDVLRRLTVRDPDWVEMGRLIHARDRVAKIMQ